MALVRAVHVRLSTAWRSAFGSDPSAVFGLMTEAGVEITTESGSVVNA